MRGFKIKSVIDYSSKNQKKIMLVDDECNLNDNYFTLLIGNNGTGKSRLLRSIAYNYIKRSSSKYNVDIEDSTFPNKIIAVTNSSFDKFPLDDYAKMNKNESYNYYYLGMRNRVNGFSSRALMNRSLDILFENYANESISENLRHIFKYLNYRPIIKLKYKLSNRIFSMVSSNTYFSQGNLIEYINEYSNRLGFRSINLRNYQEKYSHLFPEICSFLNEYRENENSEMIINFSYKNSLREGYQNDQFYSNHIKYKVLEALRRLDIVRNYDISLYKLTGEEFEFSDASSGEANVLSTLLGLIPLLEDNCLLLIDEPEISLHPLWQAQYIALIKNVLKNYNGCHIIIATHSHFLVTDLPFKSSSIISFKEKNGDISVENINENTFGWSAEDILLNIFGVPSNRNWYLAQKITEVLESFANGGVLSKNVKKSISEIKELYPHIKDSDPLKKVISLILTETRYE